MLRQSLIIAASFLAAPAFAADLPAPLEAFAAERSAACSAAGGAPRVGPAFATAVDLNGDGEMDYIVDLAGIECANAWSTFCGAEGCPLSVWIGGTGALSREWEGVAEGWRLEGIGAEADLTVDRRGAACPGAAPEAPICSERLAFEAPPAAAPAVVASPAETSAEASANAPAPESLVPLEAPGGDGWTLRTAPGGTPVAVSGGPGAFASVAVFCLAGQPWLAATLRGTGVGDTAQIGFAFSEASPVFPARREAGAGGALVIELADRPLADLLAGRDSWVQVSLDGAAQGALSLRGSTRAVRGALETCPPQ